MHLSLLIFKPLWEVRKNLLQKTFMDAKVFIQLGDYFLNKDSIPGIKRPSRQLQK